jgi:putative N6-adenine-specific DNA methylase
MKYLFVTCPHGFEPILYKELQSLGIRSISEGFCGLFIPLSWKNVFLVNYKSKVATRALWPIADFLCKDKEDLYRNTKKFPWKDFLNVNKTFAIDSNVSHPNLKNSLFASLVVKDAICDYFRDNVGSRPSVHTKFPDVQINLFIQKERAVLYIDTSGLPLHKRNWRDAGAEAPLHESLAAGLLIASGYSPDKIFCDPMCGSGTFLVEAAMIATNTPAGFLRKKWGFFHLPDFNETEWLSFRKEEDGKRIPLAKGKIFGSDRSREAAERSQKHLQKLGFGSSVEVQYEDIAFYNPPEKPNHIVANPPYGKRLEASQMLFGRLKEFLSSKCEENVNAYLLYPEQSRLEEADLHPSSILDFHNGGLPIHLFHIKNNFS